jgi:hypothetical protein
VMKIAKYNDYLWKTGKAIIVYENYFENELGTYFMYDNLWWLYDSICNVWDNINMEYCKKALKLHYYMTEKYQSLQHYKVIASLLIKMWENKTSQEVYALYLSKWWQKDSQLEEKLSD